MREKGKDFQPTCGKFHLLSKKRLTHFALPSTTSSKFLQEGTNRGNNGKYGNSGGSALDNLVVHKFKIKFTNMEVSYRYYCTINSPNLNADQTKLKVASFFVYSSMFIF